MFLGHYFNEQVVAEMQGGNVQFRPGRNPLSSCFHKSSWERQFNWLVLGQFFIALQFTPILILSRAAT